MVQERDILQLANRMRRGYNAFCATVDLLGIGSMLLQRPSEALHRINDLPVIFASGTAIFPGGKDYRVCFAGDSVFAIRELKPEDSPSDLWPTFCGHMYALSTFVAEAEQGLGNPGPRVVMAFGALAQVFQPDHWPHPVLRENTENWFVLTGASEALRKCLEVERLGKRGGFDGGFCWHEDLAAPGIFYGTQLRAIADEYKLRPDLYPIFHRTMIENADRRVQLPEENVQ